MLQGRGKMTLAGESGLGGDRGDADVRMGQKPPRPFDPLQQHILRRRRLEGALEPGGETLRTHAN